MEPARARVASPTLEFEVGSSATTYVNQDSSPRILAIDAGTSSVKALVASRGANGWTLHAKACCEHDAPATGPAGEAEQDPESWWASLVRAVRTLSESTDLGGVAAIALSGQMQSVILVDGDGAPIRPALLYSDTRAAAEAAELESRLGLERLQAETLNWKGAASVLPKLLWLQARPGPTSTASTTTTSSSTATATATATAALTALPVAAARGGGAAGGQSPAPLGARLPLRKARRARGRTRDRRDQREYHRAAARGGPVS